MSVSRKASTNHLCQYRGLIGFHLDVNWQLAFTERVWAANFLQQHARPLPVSPKKRSLRSTTSVMYPIDSFPSAHDSDPERHLRLLNALLSVVKTASPASHHRIVSRSIEDDPGLTQAHARTTIYPPSVRDGTLSLNIAWLRETLSNGLPFTLAQYLFSWNVVGYGHNTVEIQTLCRLTAYLGFVPIPVVDADTSNASPSSPSRKKRTATGSKEERAVEVQDMSEAAQRARARERARPRAFYMHYLSRRRNWGPYLAILPRAANEMDCDLGIPILEASPEDFDSDSEADADYVPPDDDASASTSSATPEPGQSPSTGTLPTPEQLHPDWAWLAAARIVAECKLRQHVDAEDIAKLEDWDNLREGAWVPDPPRPGLDDAMETLAQVQEPEPEEPEEEWKKYQHDWAGAEGIWRSVFGTRMFSVLISDRALEQTSCVLARLRRPYMCVTRALRRPGSQLMPPQIIASVSHPPYSHGTHQPTSLQNYGNFQDPQLDEAWIIVPMSLRITGYSAPSLSQLFPDRPTIHVEGEMGGGGWVGSFDGIDEDVRRVHGMVSMLPDGNVRWSTVRICASNMIPRAVTKQAHPLTLLSALPPPCFDRRRLRQDRTRTSGRPSPYSWAA